MLRWALRLFALLLLLLTGWVAVFNAVHSPPAVSPEMAQQANAAKEKMRAAGLVLADDIPVAYTPPGGYGNSFPPPVLVACTEPLVEGAPDLRGIWKTVSALRGGKPVPQGERIYNYVERIEQCGNRIVDMGGGTIADARADGTVRNGVHDVSVFDYRTPIRVVASYEDGVFVLRPLLIPYFPVKIPFVEVTRRLDAQGHMIWTRPDLGGLRVTLARIGKATDPYTRRDLPDSTTGGRE